MKTLYIIIAAALAGCAVAIGDRSRAYVNTEADVKRELGDEAPVIEEVFISKPASAPLKGK